MVALHCCEDLIGVAFEIMGVPWNEDLWSNKEDLGVEESEVRVVAIVAILVELFDEN